MLEFKILRLILNQWSMKMGTRLSLGEEAANVCILDRHVYSKKHRFFFQASFLVITPPKDMTIPISVSAFN